MEIALLVAFLFSNLAWLFFTFRTARDFRDERRELHNRIARPAHFVPEKVKDKKKADKNGREYIDPKAAELFAEQSQMDLPERLEFAAVGQIDPGLIRKEDKK
jgi:hypothetical protein